MLVGRGCKHYNMYKVEGGQLRLLNAIVAMKLLSRPIGRKMFRALYLDEYRVIRSIILAYTHHTHLCRTNFFQTALRNTFAGFRVNTRLWMGACASKEVGAWAALSIQTPSHTQGREGLKTEGNPSTGRRDWDSSPGRPAGTDGDWVFWPS